MSGAERPHRVFFVSSRRVIRAFLLFDRCSFLQNFVPQRLDAALSKMLLFASNVYCGEFLLSLSVPVGVNGHNREVLKASLLHQFAVPTKSLGCNGAECAGTESYVRR